MTLSDRSTCGLLIAILAAGCLLRAVGLTRGNSDFVLPERAREGETEAFYRFHPDEELMIASSLRSIDLLDPPLTTYGLLPVYLLRGALVGAGSLAGWEKLDLDDTRSARHIYYTARILALLFSCASLYLTWWVGRRLFGRIPALLGVGILAFAPGAIQQAHFFITDTLFLPLSIAALGAVLRALETSSRGWHLVAGLLIGALGSTRLNGLLMGGVILIGHLWLHRGSARQLFKSLLTPELWLAGLASLAILLGLQPFLVARPELLSQSGTFVDFGHALAIARLEILQPWVLVDVHTIPYWDHWFRLLPPVAGWPLTLFFIAALLFALWRLELSRGLTLLWCFLYFLLIGGIPVTAVRYAVPLLPFLGLFAGALCVAVWQWEKTPILLWSGRIVVVLILLHSTAYGLGFARIYLREDSRIQAARWLDATVPSDGRVGLEGGGFSMAKLISETRYETVRLNTTRIFYGTPYQLCRTGSDFLRERLSHMDYLVVVDANRMAQFTAVPDLFPALDSFYRQLVAGDLGFDLVQRFKTYPALPGLTFADDDTEPSFRGYDHPAVLLFRRRSEDDFARAAQGWIEGMAERPYCADRQLGEMAEALRAGDLERVVRQGEALAVSHPFSKIGHFLRAEAHRLRGETVLAEVALLRYAPSSATGLTAYVDNTNSRPDIPGDTALSLLELGLPDLALRVLQEGLPEARSYPPEAVSAYQSYIRVARRFFSRGETQHMELAMLAALEIHQDPGAYNILATLAYQRADYAGAVALWSHSLELDRDQAEIHIRIAKTLLHEMGDREQALSHLRKAVELDADLVRQLAPWIQQDDTGEEAR